MLVVAPKTCIVPQGYNHLDYGMHSMFQSFVDNEVLKIM